MARKATSSKSPRPCHQRSTVCWPTRWCAGSLPRNRTPSFPRFYGRRWCSTSSRGADGRGRSPLSCQKSGIGRVAAARRVGDELTQWRCTVPAGHALPGVAHPGLNRSVAASSRYDQPPKSTHSGHTSRQPGRLGLAVSGIAAFGLPAAKSGRSALEGDGAPYTF